MLCGALLLAGVQYRSIDVSTCLQGSETFQRKTKRHPSVPSECIRGFTLALCHTVLHGMKAVLSPWPTLLPACLSSCHRSLEVRWGEWVCHRWLTCLVASCVCVSLGVRNITWAAVLTQLCLLVSLSTVWHGALSPAAWRPPLLPWTLTLRLSLSSDTSAKSLSRAFEKSRTS